MLNAVNFNNKTVSKRVLFKASISYGMRRSLGIIYTLTNVDVVRWMNNAV